MKPLRMLNGYRVIYLPDHPKAMVSENWLGYIYEHIAIAESRLGRSIRDNEEVHHLDSNRENNLPSNLIVLERPQHQRLHSWLDKNIIIPKPGALLEKVGLLKYCPECGKQIACNMEHCSIKCYKVSQISKIMPSKEQLEEEVKTIPMTKLGSKYGVSDNSVKKWCKKLGIELGDRRGHWNKKTVSD